MHLSTTIHLPDSPNQLLHNKRENTETYLYLPRQTEVEDAHSRVQSPVAYHLTTLVTALHLENVNSRTGIHTCHLEVARFRDPLQEGTQEETQGIDKEDHMNLLYQEREGGRTLDPIRAVGRLHALDPGPCIGHRPRRVIMKEEEADGCCLFRLPDIRRTSEDRYRGLILGQSRRGEAVLDPYRVLASHYLWKEITEPEPLFSPSSLSPKLWQRVQCSSLKSKVRRLPKQQLGSVSLPLCQVQSWRVRRSSQRVCDGMMKMHRL